MKNLEIIRELEKQPVFNLKKVKEIIGKKGNYAKLVAFRLKKQKLILEIERNKYTVQKDPLIIASNLSWPSYISCWSALRYHNLTEQLPQNIFIVTTRARKKRRINFLETKMIFIKISPKYFFGYKKEIYNGFEIFIAEKEKALIDSALLKKISFSELAEIIKNNKENLDFDLLINYLIKIKNKTLIKRFGFLLEKLGFSIKKLEKFIDYKYITLDYAVQKNGRKNKKWKIIENVEL